MELEYIIDKLKRLRSERFARRLHPADVPWRDLIRDEHPEEVRPVMRQALAQGLIKVRRTLNGHLIVLCGNGSSTDNNNN